VQALDSGLLDDRPDGRRLLGERGADGRLPLSHLDAEPAAAVTLRVEVDDEAGLVGPSERRAQGNGGGRLADPALVRRDGDGSCHGVFGLRVVATIINCCETAVPVDNSCMSCNCS
jgi:hypothetical protein